MIEYQVERLPVGPARFAAEAVRICVHGVQFVRLNLSIVRWANPRPRQKFTSNAPARHRRTQLSDVFQEVGYEHSYAA